MSGRRMAAYCRVSTDREEQLSSLDNQRGFFEQYAAKTGDELVEIYADEGISGKSMKKRPSFMRLLADSEKDRFDYVAVKDISRFARNTSDFLFGIRTLRENGVDVCFLSGSQTVIGESEFVLTVFAALAQEESANLSKRVIFGKKQNAKKGRVPNIIYGYDKTDTYTLAVNERESEIVRLIFKWYINGDGTRCIAARLNEMGIPTKKRTLWSSKTVRRILQNPVYKGVLVNNKSVTKDFLSGTRMSIPEEEWFVHERPALRVVSDEDFERVQTVLAQRREQYKSGEPRHSNKYVFSNIIKCGECGGSFTARVYRWKNEYVRYRCAAHNNGNAHCMNSVTVDEGALEEEIKKYLISCIDDSDAFLKRLNLARRADRSPEYTNTLTEARERLLNRRRRIKEMYISGLIDIDELRSEFDDIERGINDIDTETAPSDDAAEEIDGAEDIIMKHIFSNEEMRALVDRIVVGQDKSVTVFMR